MLGKLRFPACALRIERPWPQCSLETVVLWKGTSDTEAETAQQLSWINPPERAPRLYACQQIWIECYVFVHRVDNRLKNLQVPSKTTVPIQPRESPAKSSSKVGDLKKCNGRVLPRKGKSSRGPGPRLRTSQFRPLPRVCYCCEGQSLRSCPAPANLPSTNQWGCSFEGHLVITNHFVENSENLGTEPLSLSVHVRFTLQG